MVVHDVTGDCFESGVTNFTGENLFDLIRKVGIVTDDVSSVVTIRTTKTIRNRLNYWNLIDNKANAFWDKEGDWFHGYLIEVDPSLSNYGTQESFIRLNGSECGKLVTREF